MWMAAGGTVRLSTPVPIISTGSYTLVVDTQGDGWSTVFTRRVVRIRIIHNSSGYPPTYPLERWLNLVLWGVYVEIKRLLRPR
jgi:hypothetical protein